VPEPVPPCGHAHPLPASRLLSNPPASAYAAGAAMRRAMRAMLLSAAVQERMMRVCQMPCAFMPVTPGLASRAVPAVFC